jgi:hypothetical protein
LDRIGAITAQNLTAFSLSSDWRAGTGSPELWAIAGNQPTFSGTSQPFVMRYAGGTWTQLVPNPNLSVNTCADTCTPGWPGSSQQAPDIPVPPHDTPAPQVIAAEPNENAAWIAVIPSNGIATTIQLDRVQVTTGSDGSVSGANVEQFTLGPIDEGVPTAISCPAEADCWLGTDHGWLFHLTNGTQMPQDTDPNFAGVIAYRPPDGGTPAVIPPVELGVSISPPPVTTPNPPTTTPSAPKVIRKKAKPLVTHLSRLRLIHRYTLVLSFTLTAKAHVQLIAKRKGSVVAQTRRAVLKPGRHTLELPLDPKHWPTGLKLDVTPLGAPTPGSGGGGSTGGSTGGSPGGPTVVST